MNWNDELPPDGGVQRPVDDLDKLMGPIIEEVARRSCFDVRAGTGVIPIFISIDIGYIDKLPPEGIEPDGMIRHLQVRFNVAYRNFEENYMAALKTQVLKDAKDIISGIKKEQNDEEDHADET